MDESTLIAELRDCRYALMATNAADPELIECAVSAFTSPDGTSADIADKLEHAARTVAFTDTPSATQIAQFAAALRERLG